ncbi:MAG: hypothetical protein IPJ61_21700 [Tessaracoccus sp.]|uniref:hypothetical protein n=1 Tax=Tessaracoccus sp. TaxID=1971211 RepID=UPI001EB12001|nr:hypothetical protein [Tessaracoccus sp.]MBK7823605.1 hypothetical protein [Tessaracoccus sp.]
MSVDVGDVYSTSITVDVDGTPADATTVTALVTYPDGTTGDPHVDHYGVGLYRTGVPALMPGLHVIDWQATGLHESAYRDSFTATDPAGVPAVSLRQVKGHLNITTQDSDEELRSIVADVASIAESYTGRVFGRRTVVDTLTGDGGPYLSLSACPVLAVASVTVDGVPVTNYRANHAAGILTRTAGWTCDTAIVVTYLAGYRVQPGADVQGALRMCAHLWKYQRGSVQARGGSWADEAPFAVPNFVAELWDLNRITGFA